MTRHRILRSLLICSAALATTNCAAIQKHFAWLHLAPKPVAKFEPKSAAPSGDIVKAALDDSFYADAVKAIDRRDYGSALEMLQAARERSPDDVRVLNAFGVVYDKLGRFDLSGRYYQQAAALDPGSTIVASNEAYSRELQARAASSHFTAPAEVQVASVAPAPAAVVQSPPPMIVTTVAKAAVAPAPAAPTPVTKAPATTTLASAAPKPAPIKPAPLQVLPTKGATLQTVAFQLQTLLSPRLPTAFIDRSPETASAPTVVVGPKPAPLEVAAVETVSVARPFDDQALDRSTAFDTLQVAPQIEPEAKPQPIAPVIATTLASADTSAPQMGRVVPDGPGRVRLVPGARPTTLAYAPKSVMTLEGPAPRTAAEGPALLASNGRIVEVAPGVLRLEAGSHPTMVALARTPGLTGYPLAVIDASGRVDGAKATLTHLASLGWTARIAPSTPSRQHSTIYYEAGDLEVAQGLARTLPIPVQIAACEQACRGVTLVVGADALGRTGRG